MPVFAFFFLYSSSAGGFRVVNVLFYPPSQIVFYINHEVAWPSEKTVARSKTVSAFISHVASESKYCTANWTRLEIAAAAARGENGYGYLSRTIPLIAMTILVFLGGELPLSCPPTVILPCYCFTLSKNLFLCPLAVPFYVLTIDWLEKHHHRSKEFPVYWIWRATKLKEDEEGFPSVYWIEKFLMNKKFTIAHNHILQWLAIGLKYLPRVGGMSSCLTPLE